MERRNDGVNGRGNYMVGSGNDGAGRLGFTIDGDLTRDRLFGLYP